MCWCWCWCFARSGQGPTCTISISQLLRLLDMDAMGWDGMVCLCLGLVVYHQHPHRPPADAYLHDTPTPTCAVSSPASPPPRLLLAAASGGGGGGPARLRDAPPWLDPWPLPQGTRIARPSLGDDSDGADKLADNDNSLSQPVRAPWRKRRRRRRPEARGDMCLGPMCRCPPPWDASARPSHPAVTHSLPPTPLGIARDGSPLASFSGFHLSWLPPLPSPSPAVTPSRRHAVPAPRTPVAL